MRLWKNEHFCDVRTFCAGVWQVNAYCELEIYWTVRTGWREGRTFWNVLASSELEAFLVVKDSWRVESSLETAFRQATIRGLRGLCLARIL